MGLEDVVKSTWAELQEKSIRTYSLRSSDSVRFGISAQTCILKSIPDHPSRNTKTVTTPETYPFILCRGHCSWVSFPNLPHNSVQSDIARIFPTPLTQSEVILVDTRRCSFYPFQMCSFLPLEHQPLCLHLSKLFLYPQGSNESSSIFSNPSNSSSFHTYRIPIYSILSIWYSPCLFILCGHFYTYLFSLLDWGPRGQRPRVMSSVLPIFWTYMAQRKTTPLELGARTNQAASSVDTCWFCLPGIHPPSSGTSIIILHSLPIHAQTQGEGLQSGQVAKV